MQVLHTISTAALFAAATALPATSTELRLSHSHQPSLSSEIHIAAWVFRNWVNENAVNLNVEIFAANALGEERAVYEAMQLGGGASCKISGAAILANFAPAVGVVDLPFLWEDYSHIHRALDGELGEALAEEIEEIGFKVVGWLASWGFRNVATRTQPVRSAEDMAGLRIRTIQSPVYVAALNAMGANATPMPFGEVYTGLQTGVLDGFEHGFAVTRSMRFYEVSSYMSRTEHIITPLAFVCSVREWNSWSEADREIVLEGARLAQDINRALAPHREAEALDYLVAAGMEIIDIDVTPFRANALPLQDELAAQLGATKHLEMVRAAGAGN